MTPEEQVAAATKLTEEANAKVTELAAQIEATKSSGNTIESMQAKMVAMEKTNADNLAENNRMKIESAQGSAVAKYPNAAGMPGLIGANEAEIEANAKLIHDNIANKTEAVVKAKEVEMQTAWGKIPQGSVPTLLKQDDLDAEKDRISKITNPLERYVAKMRMGLYNLGHKTANAGRT